MADPKDEKIIETAEQPREQTTNNLWMIVLFVVCISNMFFTALLWNQSLQQPLSTTQNVSFDSEELEETLETILQDRLTEIIDGQVRITKALSRQTAGVNVKKIEELGKKSNFVRSSWYDQFND